MKLIAYVIKITAITFLSLLPLVNASNLDQLQQLEDRREDAFISSDCLHIEELTRQISEIISEKKILSENDTAKCLNSILRTRHLFPGKANMISDFYGIDTFLSDFEFLHTSSPSLDNTLALIIVSDTVADLSCVDPDFYMEIQSVAKGNSSQYLKTKVLDELRNSDLNKVYLNSVKKEVRSLMSDDFIIKKICEMECNFPPIITFKNLYEDIMVTPYHCNNEIVGVGQYSYWPSRSLTINERKDFQKNLCNNNFSKYFKPLSLTMISIDRESIADYKFLENRVGSFCHYIARPFLEFDPIEFLLINDNLSGFPYNRDSIKKVREYYLNTTTTRVAYTEEDFRYYAEQGITSAQNEYANILFNKRVVDSSILDSLIASYFRRAANQGNIFSMYNIGMLYEEGIGVAKNYEKAIDWYKSSAQLGLSDSQYRLGVIYQGGIGVPRSDLEAVKWYRLAAQQGHRESQCKLGRIYEYS